MHQTNFNFSKFKFSKANFLRFILIFYVSKNFFVFRIYVIYVY